MKKRRLVRLSERYAIYLSEQHSEQLMNVAEEDGIPVSEFCRRLVVRELGKRNRFARLRRKSTQQSQSLV
jgi:cytidylate kinase